MATRRGAQTRRELADLRAAADGDGRYQDLALHLRALRADFGEPVPVDHEFRAGGVEFVTTAAGQEGVPVRSVQLQASGRAADGTPIEGGGVLRCEVLLAAGGRWDLLRREFAGEVQAPRILDLVESQWEYTRFFAAWLRRYKARRARPVGKERDVRVVLPFGNRGSGKTWVSMCLLLALALEVPGSVVWFVVENRPASREDVNETFESDILPSEWGRWRGQPDYLWRLVNRSRIYVKSADDPASLKAGRVDGLMINEAAKLPRTVYGYATARTKDRGGISLLPTNPPTIDKPKGIWVYRLWERWREDKAQSKWFPLEVFTLLSSGNSTIDRGADEDLGILLRAVAPELVSADDGGMMILPGERIVKTFDVLRHGLRAPPDIGDITAEFLRRHQRARRPFRYLAGLDFQGTGPGIVCTFFRIYGTLDKPILWAVSDVAMRVDEETFLDELLGDGIRVGETEYEDIEPTTVCWIGDSSAQWQSSKHEAKVPPSFVPWLNRGLFILSPTVPVTEGAKWGRNPPVGRSIGQLNRWCAEGRFHVSPLATMLRTAMKEGKAEDTPRGIRPDKDSSHSLDTARYPLWFIDPPTKRARPAERRETCYAVE